MKFKLRLLSIFCLAALAMGAFGTVGCQINPKADKVAVSAEISTQVGWDVMDTFVHLEYDHRAELKQWFGPGVHQAANEVRKYGRKAVSDALDLIDAYENNRTAENKANLATALAVVQKLANKAGSYVRLTQTKSPALVPKTPSQPEVLKKAAKLGVTPTS